MAITLSSSPASYSSRATFVASTNQAEDATHVNVRIDAEVKVGSVTICKKVLPKARTTFDFTDVLRSYCGMTNPTPFTNPADTDIVAPTKTGSNLLTGWTNKTSFLWTNFTASGANISVCNGTPTGANMMCESNDISFVDGTTYVLLWKSKVISGATTPWIEIGSTGATPLGTYSNNYHTEIDGDDADVKRMYFTAKSTGTRKLTIGATDGAGAVSLAGNFEMYAMLPQDWYKQYSIKFTEKYEDAAGVTQTGSSSDNYKLYTLLRSSLTETDFIAEYIEANGAGGVSKFLTPDGYFEGVQRSTQIIQTPYSGHKSTANLMAAMAPHIYNVDISGVTFTAEDIYSPLIVASVPSTSVTGTTIISLTDTLGLMAVTAQHTISVLPKCFPYHIELHWMNSLGGISQFFFGDDYTKSRVILRRDIFKDASYIDRTFRTASAREVTVSSLFHHNDNIAEYLADITGSLVVQENTNGYRSIAVQTDSIITHQKGEMYNAEVRYQYDESAAGAVVPDAPVPPITGTTYYIDVTGTDSAAVDGGISTPWKTLAYAFTRVTTPGDGIYVNPGTHTETVQSIWPVGVSVVGAGATSIITSATAFEPMILASSTSEGTDGNQSISYVKLDGGMAVNQGISIRRRKNVSIHHVAFEDFIYSAVEIYGGAAFTTVPTTYATGIVVRNCTIINCCQRRDPGIFGALRIGGTQDMEVYSNTMTQNSRSVGNNGNLVYLWGATNKAWKFYNNTCTKPDTDGIEDGYAGGWNFHIESGNSSGFEIYDNTFIGGVAIDLAGGIQVKGDYTYSWYIHNNDFSISTQIATPTAGTHPPHAIDYERTNEDVIVRNNKFTNYPTAINITLDEVTYHKLRLYFYYNIFSNCGYSDGLYAFGGIQFVGSAAATGDLCSYVYIYNNVFEADGARGLIHLQSPYNLDHFYIRNNICIDAASYGWLNVWDKLGDDTTNTGTYDSFFIENNLLYNNANANAIYYRGGKAITNLTGWSPQTNILGSDPLFVSATDFHLQAASPAIGAGMDVDLLTDYDGVSVGAIPEIGAYEY